MPTPSRNAALERLLRDLGPQIGRGNHRASTLKNAAASCGTDANRESAVLRTGLAEIDELLEGGLPSGCISELFGEMSSGRTSLALRLLAKVTRGGGLAAWIDASDSFAPHAAAGFGVELSQLLWVRAPQPVQALRCAEAILKTAGFGLVVLDVAPCEVAAQRRLAQLPTSAWLRLRRAARKDRTPLVLLSRRPLAGFAATLSLELRARQLLFTPAPTAICGIESELRTHRSPNSFARRQLKLSA